MKFRFTIGRKIVAGFGVMIVMFVIAFLIARNTVRQASDINHTINEVNRPSTKALETLKNYIIISHDLINRWAVVESREDVANKIELIELEDKTIPALMEQIDSLADFWEPDEQELLAEIFAETDTMFQKHEFIKENLTSLESYSDVSIMFEVGPMVEKNGEIDVQTTLVTVKLDELLKSRRKNSQEALTEMNEAFDWQSLLFLIFLLVVVVGGILVAIFTVRSIVKPVQKLRGILLSLGRGVFPEQDMKVTNDEIGDMALASNALVEGLKRTTDFSKEVGSGNFDSPYQPLSGEDKLGQALLKMRDDLAENERILEQKVIERTEEVVRQKEEIEVQNQKLEELYKDITDSIRYAKRLQESILPSERYIKDMLPNSFVLYKPKDIVSGDFYWFQEVENKILFAAVDCTGHGVPGAFMSIVGHNGLNSAVKEHKFIKPSDILNDLNKLATETLNQNVGETQVRDGMDLALCSLDIPNMKLEYSGAYNPLYLIREGEIMQTKADKFAIGGRAKGKNKLYTNHEIDLQKGDTIYIFSDGFADQFGGPKGKKFMYKQFRDLLLEIWGKEMDEQKAMLDSTIETWKGSFEQVDDILVIGVKV